MGLSSSYARRVGETTVWRAAATSTFAKQTLNSGRRCPAIGRRTPLDTCVAWDEPFIKARTQQGTWEQSVGQVSRRSTASYVPASTEDQIEYPVDCPAPI